MSLNRVHRVRSPIYAISNRSPELNPLHISMSLPVQSTSIVAHMASSQNTTYANYPCPLWGKKIEDIIETGVGSAGNKYRFIRRSWFNLLSPVKTATEEPAILIRDPYEALYNNVLTQRSSPRGPEDPYSGIAVIGQPGIGQWHLCLAGG